MEIIVLSSTQYKENDLIYNAISETEYFSFKASRALKANSAIVWLNNPLTVADIELSTDKRYTHPVLKEAKFVSSSMEDNNKVDYFFSIGVIADIATSVLPDEEKHLLYRDIKDSLSAIKKGKNEQMVLLILLARAIRFAGSQLEVDKCVFCGATKDIVSFSFVDGGFICRNCLDSSDHKAELTPNQMKLVRYAFKSPDYSCVGIEKYPLEDRVAVLCCFKEFIKDDLGVNLKSVDMFLK